MGRISTSTWTLRWGCTYNIPVWIWWQWGPLWSISHWFEKCKEELQLVRLFKSKFIVYIPNSWEWMADMWCSWQQSGNLVTGLLHSCRQLFWSLRRRVAFWTHQTPLLNLCSRSSFNRVNYGGNFCSWLVSKLANSCLAHWTWDLSCQWRLHQTRSFKTALGLLAEVAAKGSPKAQEENWM